MTLGKRPFPTCGALAAAIFLAGTPLVSTAQSACKGLDEGSCATSEGCAWIKSYTRSDGKQVSGYCRLKSGGAKPKADAAAAPAQEGGQVAASQQ